MSSSCAWLPPIMPYSGITAELDDYLETLYTQFKQDFIYTYPTFNGHRVTVRAYPKEEDKEQAFFHLTTEGVDNRNRTYDFSRCERIAWPKPIIEHAHELRVWEGTRQTKARLSPRVYIATPSFDYLVTLEPKENGTYTLITAFYIQYKHSREKKEAEYIKSRGRT